MPLLSALDEGISEYLSLHRLGLDPVALSVFMTTLEQAALWCEDRAEVNDSAHSLRSELLKPDLVLGDSVEDYAWDTSEKRPQEAVARLAAKRAQAQGTTLLSSNTSLLTQGRLVVLWPFESLVDGAACQLTNGYFDSWNMPPWDTWLHYGLVNNLPALVSGVPPQFVDIASEGIWTNPEECIQWLRLDQHRANYNRPSATIHNRVN